jgi:hypothetical protein
MAPSLHHRVRNLLVASALVVGVGAGSAAVASAATGSHSTTSTSLAPPTGSRPADAPDPDSVTHGPGETLLTGSAEKSAVDAATATEPGATVIRAETDSAGSAYEVHMTKADGTHVTVKLDSNFKVTETDPGFGPGPADTHPPMGPNPDGPATSTSTN